MPNFDGWETLKAIRQNPKISKIPIIMITARSQDEDKIIGEETGADEYITKPFEIDELLARIVVQLRRNESVQNDSYVKVGNVILMHCGINMYLPDD